MKNFYKVSNTIENGPRMDRKRTVVGPMKDRQWSRISPINHRLWTVIAPMLFVAFGLFGVNESAWGLEESITVTDFNSYTTFSDSALNHVTSNVFTNKRNHVTFTIDGVNKYGDERLVYSDQAKNSTKTVAFSWNGDANYDVEMKGIDVKVRAWSITNYSASAYFGTNTPVSCNTNKTGKKGAQSISTTTGLSGNSVNFSMVNNSSGWSGGTVAFTLHDIKFTYKVSHIQYLYGFEAILGGVNNTTYGSATASGKDTVRSNFSPLAKAEKVVSFSATVTDSKKYKFLGWYTDEACETGFVSGANPYTPTLENTKAGTFVTKTLYAKFGEKGQPTVNCTIADEYEIGHEPIDLQTLWTREGNGAITYSIVPNSFVASGTNNTGAVEPALSEGRYLSLGQAGTLQLKMVIDADGDEYLARTVTKDITINKHVPEFTWYCDANTVLYNKVIENFCTSNQSTTSITRTNSEESVATLSGTTLTTYNIAGTTRVTMTQAENYYWAGHSEYRDITPAKANNHVSFTANNDNYSDLENSRSSNDESNVSWKSSGFYRLGDGTVVGTRPDEWVIIRFEGIPDKLSFTINCETNGVGAIQSYPAKNDYEFFAYESATGNTTDWTELNWGFDNSSSFSSPIDVNVQLSPATRYIKLRYHGSCWGHFENIQVTELQYFRRQGENTTLDFATNVKNHVPAVQSFVVEHANAGYQTWVTAPDHYHVSLDNVNFASSVTYSTNETAVSGGDKMGTFTVYVKYLADAEGTHAGNVVVHNNLRTDFNVPVTGTTKDKIATQIEYCGASSYSVDAANIASTTLFRVRDTDNDTIVTGVGISLSCEENEQFSIAGGNALDPKCGGSATVTASYTGDETYAAASDLAQAITITKIDDVLNLAHGKSVILIEDNYDLSTWGATAESGSAISFSSSDETKFRIEAGHLIAVGKGKANLIIESAGNCQYNAGSKTFEVKVRLATDPCETLLVDESKNLSVKSSSSYSPYTFEDGKPDVLTFDVKKHFMAAKSNIITATILDGNGNSLTTKDVSADSISADTPKTIRVPLTSYPTANKVQFTGNGSLYSQYINNVKVTSQAYLTASTTSVTMSSVKACVQAEGQFNISYSDVSRILLTQTNDDFTYEVWRGDTKLDGFDNDCGEYGTYTVKFFYTPQAKGDYSDTVTLSASGKSQTITLSGTAAAPDREIVWDIPAGNEIVATQSVDLTAYAKTACADSPAGSVYYTWSSIPEIDGAATIEGTTVTFHKEATVTVTAHTVSSDDYNDAADVAKVWTVKKVGVDLLEIPTITSTITVGNDWRNITHDSLFTAVSALDHNIVIEGTVDYTGKDVFNSAGQTSIKFTFTPNSDFFDTYKTFQFDVPVDVQHIASNATPSAEAITYGAAISSSTLSNSGTTAGTWTWNTENNDAVLDAGQHTLNVHFTPENSNYSELDATVTLKVNKATTSLNWTNAPEDLAYNATGVTYTASSASDGTITYSIIAGGAYASIDGNGVLTIIEPGHTITIQASQAAGTNHTAPVAITVDVTIAAAPSAPTFNNVAGDNDWQNADNWSNGEVPSGENPDVIISGELIINEDVTVGGLTILPTGSVAVVTNGTLTIKGTSETRSEYGDMHVADDGNVVLGNSADLKVRHFFLDAKLGDSSTQAASGQVKGNGALNVIGDAYFQMKFDPSGAITYGWYDFVVPFAVNITNGISRVGSLDDRIMVSGTDFLVMEDDEAGYVAGGKGWRTMNSGTLLPGRLYTITFNYQSALPQNTFLFEWNKQGNLSNGQTFEAQCLVSADEDRTGWNAIGNGMLCHGYIANGYKVQTYDHTQNKYNVLHQHSTFAIGTAFFVQVAAAGTINWNAAEATNERPLYAPQREMNTVDEFFLTLRDAATEQMADVLFFSASEEATEAYVIGHDLVKRGNPTEAKAAQMWATKNGKKLCDIETALNNNAAIAPLSIFAPNAGQYTLAIEEAPADASLYLTYNGAVIWDLTASPYVFDLTKGTTEGYGLRIEAANAPQVTTGVENGGLMNDANSVRKVIIDNKMYIITPEGAIFDVIGKKVQ